MIVLIDNYDSFSYNLYQLIGALRPDIRVVRNDELSVDEIRKLRPSHVILSPGPGYPRDAGVCVEAARELSDTRILGVCLGHQAICEAFGATISHAKQLMHGRQSMVSVKASCPLFKGLMPWIPAGRYHSLAARRDTLPAELKIMAETDDGEVMAVQHASRPVFGLQFHPESILTPDGVKILSNFINL
jgi:anthranilate synthase component 2